MKMSFFAFGTLGTVFITLMTLSLAAEPSDLYRITVDAMTDGTLSAIYFRDDATASNTILAGEGSGKVWAAWGDWADDAAFTVSVARQFDVPDATNCENPMLGIGEPQPYLGFGCQDSTGNNDGKVVLVRLSSQDSSLLSQGIFTLSGDVETINGAFTAAYMEATVVFTARNSNDQTALVYGFGSDFSSSFKMDSSNIKSPKVIGLSNSNNFWVIAETATGGNIYVSHFHPGANLQAHLTLSNSNAKVQSVARGEEDMMICFEERNDDGDITNRSIYFIDMLDMEVKALRTIASTESADFACFSSADGKKFFATIGTKTKSLSTWVFDENYNLTSAVSIDTSNSLYNNYRYASGALACTSDDCDHLLIAGNASEGTSTDTVGIFASFDSEDMTTTEDIGAVTNGTVTIANTDVDWNIEKSNTGVSVTSSNSVNQAQIDTTVEEGFPRDDDEDDAAFGLPTVFGTLVALLVFTIQSFSFNVQFRLFILALTIVCLAVHLVIISPIQKKVKRKK